MTKKGTVSISAKCPWAFMFLYWCFTGFWERAEASMFSLCGLCGLFFKLKNFLEYSWFICKFLVLPQSESVIRIDTSLLFQVLFPYRLLLNMEQVSLCHTVGPCLLSNTLSCGYANPKLLIYASCPRFPFGNHTFDFTICESFSLL